MAVHARRQFGDRGEDLAVAFFVTRGFRVIQRNWTCRLGEIDLIIERDGRTHFIEVKTRRSQTYGYPEEAITKTKLRHLARAIETYLRTARVIPKQYQVDALAIRMLPDQQPELTYIEHIL